MATTRIPRSSTSPRRSHSSTRPTSTRTRRTSCVSCTSTGCGRRDTHRPAAEVRIYAAHLKASTGFESQRLAECTGIRDNMNAMPAGTRAILCGDLNFYTQSAEPGYAKLLESQVNNIGRMYDLLPAGAWHDNAAFAAYHTQSPCLSGTCASGAATGGLDDRFDFILPTVSLGTGQGMAVIPGTCISVGNDGQHLNKNITDAPTLPEGAAYATAIKLASDHLPVRIDLQMPAKIAVDASLAFGSVIVGAPAQIQILTVDNPAVAPGRFAQLLVRRAGGFRRPRPRCGSRGGFGPCRRVDERRVDGKQVGKPHRLFGCPGQPDEARLAHRNRPETRRRLARFDDDDPGRLPRLRRPRAGRIHERDRPHLQYRLQRAAGPPLGQLGHHHRRRRQILTGGRIHELLDCRHPPGLRRGIRRFGRRIRLDLHGDI